MIIIVVATDAANGIGKNNQLLWHLPADLKHFKQITSGHTVIMGRKTYDSIGKPLPNRKNIVITRQLISIEGCTVANSLKEALHNCSDDEDAFVIGGAEIYKQALHLCQRIYLTRVEHSFDADTFFPILNHDEWHELSKENHAADEKNAFPYSFITLERR